MRLTFLVLLLVNFLNAQIISNGLGSSNGVQFEKQNLFALDFMGLGHTVLQQKENGGTRLYLMPKGNIADDNALASGLKIFSTDYSADGYNYHDWGIFATNKELVNNSKRRGTYGVNLPFVWKYQDNIEIMTLQAKQNGALMLGVEDSYKRDWKTFLPFQLGRSTFILGRDNAQASEFINNAYYDGKWKRLDFGEAHRFSLSTNGSFVFYTSAQLQGETVVEWIKKFEITNNGTIRIYDCRTFDNDAQAGFSGLQKGDVYQTPTGELRIKL